MPMKKPVVDCDRAVESACDYLYRAFRRVGEAFERAMPHASLSSELSSAVNSELARAYVAGRQHTLDRIGCQLYKPGPN